MERETESGMTIYVCSKGSPGNMWRGRTRRYDVSRNPCPSIQATGIAADKIQAHWIEIENDGKESMKSDSTKPPYKVPSMKKIRALKPNGYKVISTFSGCGGSCTGYRMAGYKVLWANEFVPAAQESYKANAASDCILDPRDIRQVTAAEILKATKLKKGELDLFDGSPPCQAFSTAGKREKGWGKDRAYEHGAKQRNEDLFFEYIRLLDGLQPKVFVAENVSGLVKGTAKGYFLEILAGLKACGYNVKAKLLDAQWLGVPQQRQRIIFVGVRNDLGLDPVFPKPFSYRYSVRDAIPELISARSGPTGFSVGSQTADTPAPTVSAFMQAPYGAHKVEIRSKFIHDESGQWSKGDISNISAPTIRAQKQTMFIEAEDNKLCRIVKRKFTIAELKRICAFPDDFILTGSYSQQWERLGNSVPPVMMCHIAKQIQTEILDKIE